MKNGSNLYDNNKVNIDEVWSTFVTPTAVNYVPVVCVSFNLFKLNLKGYSMLHIFNNGTFHNGLFIYTSDPYQFNPNRDNDDNFDMFPSGKQKMMKIKMRQSERKPTGKYTCDEFNQQRYAECVELYIVKHLQCKPSWFQIVSEGDSPTCSGAEKYLKFLALLRNLKKAIQNCTIPNCRQNTWTTQEIWTTDLDNLTELKIGDTGTAIQFFALATAVEVSTEEFTYGIFNIFNDFAGVVSLLLGVSIISFYDYIFEMSRKIYLAFKK